MDEAHCWRCDKKLVVIDEPGTGTIIEICKRCKAINKIDLSTFMKEPTA